MDDGNWRNHRFPGVDREAGRELDETGTCGRGTRNPEDAWEGSYEWVRLELDFPRKVNEEEESGHFVGGLWVSCGDGSGTLTASTALPARGGGKDIAE